MIFSIDTTPIDFSIFTAKQQKYEYEKAQKALFCLHREAQLTMM
jgi:hypothetical protein